MKTKNVFEKSCNLPIILILLIFFQSSLFSQKGKFSLNEDCKLFLNDCNKIYSRITSLRKKDLLKTGLITAGTVLLFSFDSNFKDFAQSHQNEKNSKIFNFDKYYGNAYTAGFTLGIYSLGIVLKNPKVRRTGLKSIEAFAYSGIITTILKVIIGRRRPYGGDNPLFFKPFQKEVVYKSLPSGHTTVSFAVSTVIAKSWDNRIWKIFWYGAAGMAGASRIYHNAHWASDVFLGGIIGYTVADFLMQQDNNNNNTVINKIHPFLWKNGIGLSLQL